MEPGTKEDKKECEALTINQSSDVRFLVVDDQPEICALLEHLLRAGGFYGESCTSGEEALSILRQGRFHVVLADLNMPGIGGMALLEEVRTQFPDVAFVMITGTGDIRCVVRAFKAGTSDYLCKPIQLDDLIASVRRAVEIKRSEERVLKNAT